MYNSSLVCSWRPPGGMGALSSYLTRQLSGFYTEKIAFAMVLFGFPQQSIHLFFLICLPGKKIRRERKALLIYSLVTIFKTTHKGNLKVYFFRSSLPHFMVLINRKHFID